MVGDHPLEVQAARCRCRRNSSCLPDITQNTGVKILKQVILWKIRFRFHSTASAPKPTQMDYPDTRLEKRGGLTPELIFSMFFYDWRWQFLMPENKKHPFRGCFMSLHGDNMLGGQTSCFLYSSKIIIFKEWKKGQNTLNIEEVILYIDNLLLLIYSIHFRYSIR